MRPRGVLRDGLRVPARRVNYGHSVPRGGVQVNVANRRPADTYQSQRSGGLKGLLEHEVGLDHEYGDSFVVEPRSELVRVLEATGVEPALMSDVQTSSEDFDSIGAERGEDKCR